MKKFFVFLLVLLSASCINAARIYEEEGYEFTMLKLLSDLADPAGTFDGKSVADTSLNYLFDNDIENSNGVATNRTKPFRLAGTSGYVWYDFGEGNEQVVDAIGFTPTAHEWTTNKRCINNFEIYGTNGDPRNTNSEFVLLYSATDQNLETLFVEPKPYPWNRYVYTFNNNQAYRGYRIQVENCGDGSYTEIHELELFNSGKDFSEKIFVRGQQYDCGTVSTGFGVVSVAGQSSITITATAGTMEGKTQIYGVPTGFNVYTIGDDGNRLLKATYQGTRFELVLDGSATEVEVLHDYSVTNRESFPMYVGPQGHDYNDGFSPATAKKTLRDTAQYLDEMFAENLIDKGVIYVLPGTNTVKVMTVLTNNISVVGFGEKPEDVILAPQPLYSPRFFHINHKDAVVANLTMYNGYIKGLGGAVFIGDNTNDKASRIVYTAPEGMDGGMVTNCIIDSCRTEMEHTTVGGAGVYMSSTNAVVTHTTIKNCVLDGNTSWDGNLSGAVTAVNGSRLSNCLIKNTTLGTVFKAPDAACVMTASGAIVENCTIVDSEGINYHGVYTRDNTVKVINTVIANVYNNYTSGDVTNRVLSAVGGDYSCFVKCATDSVNKTSIVKVNDTCYMATPSEMFENYAEGNYTPALGSILMNKGTLEGITIPATDLAGNERIKFDDIDIGCYEAQRNLCTIIVVR